MYKDPERQREANRQAKMRQRVRMATIEGQAQSRGMTTEQIQGMTPANNIIPKRGKDIKCFEDLPPDVQQTIDRMSTVDGKIDKAIKANRTAIAVNYQHLFPDSYHSTGVAI